MLLMVLAALLSLGTTAGARTVRIGVMLPLHNDDGDGRRMVEYYRGVLMACAQLKSEGLSTDVRAWNVRRDADIRPTLLEQGADRCDIIFGPLYTSQVTQLADFAEAYGIKVVIPFSISGNDVDTHPNLFQVYRTNDDMNTEAVTRFIQLFAETHPVFVDCNDKESRKGSFTFALRKMLEERHIDYSITNLNNSDTQFAKAFSLTQPNMVILNTGRSPELNAVIKRLDRLTAGSAAIDISLFGYIDWLMYEKHDKEKFFKYNTYIPSYFYYNAASAATQQLEHEYQHHFHTTMIEALPRFALTGYDQAMFFIRGLHDEGTDFDGTTAYKQAVQTQLRFRRAAVGGGMRNSNFLLIHYNPNKTISTITF